MNKNEKTALVPRLRFPEFVINGAINFESGDIIFEPVNNKNHNSDLPVLAITQEYGAIPRDQIDYNVSVTDKILDSYKIVEIGDFIISLRSFQGGIEYSLYHGICSPAYIILRERVPIVEQYYKHYFKTDKFIQDLNKDLEGIRDGKMVSYSQFSAIMIPKPDNKEQQKIADCLSSLDDLITAEDKKLEALKAHKKGLMQKLFPAEGETVPEIRLKGFTNTWERRKLGKIYNFKYGQYNNNPSNGGKYPVYGANGIIGGYTDFNAEDSVVIGHMGAYAGEVLWAEGKHFVTYNGTIAYPKTSEFDSIYGYYMLKHLQIRKVCIGSGQPFLAYDVLNKIDCVITNNHKEQTVIGNLFRNLDEFIMSQTKKIETLKLHKKGLMQGLFPSIEVDE